MAVCDARSQPEKIQAVVEDRLIDVPIAIDRPAEGAVVGIGSLANSLGIRFEPRDRLAGDTARQRVV